MTNPTANTRLLIRIADVNHEVNYETWLQARAKWPQARVKYFKPADTLALFPTVLDGEEHEALVHRRLRGGTRKHDGVKVERLPSKFRRRLPVGSTVTRDIARRGLDGAKVRYRKVPREAQASTFMQRWLCDGDSFSFTVWATSEADAWKKVIGAGYSTTNVTVSVLDEGQITQAENHSGTFDAIPYGMEDLDKYTPQAELYADDVLDPHNEAVYTAQDSSFGDRVVEKPEYKFDERIYGEFGLVFKLEKDDSGEYISVYNRKKKWLMCNREPGFLRESDGTFFTNVNGKRSSFKIKAAGSTYVRNVWVVGESDQFGRTGWEMSEEMQYDSLEQANEAATEARQAREAEMQVNAMTNAGSTDSDDWKERADVERNVLEDKLNELSEDDLGEMVLRIAHQPLSYTHPIYTA